ncbi:MAG TPA: N-acetylglucosamine-6-phosphate deacetylase [Puia sp.]|nr:N-acetylglucosamine-6-phosphate deacetylase [Puia sp.]
MRTIKIFNGKVLTPGGLIPRGTVLVRDATIAEVIWGDMDVEGAVEIDAHGQYVSPGFIDIHVHGGGGHDFMDGTVEAFLGAAALHARYGTTAMLPTTLSCPPEKLFRVLDVYPEACRLNVAGSQFLGLHLEGPYLSMVQKGAQDGRYIRRPRPEEYRSILDRAPGIRRWSAAPELEGALEFGRFLRERGVLAAFAHTDALYEEILEGYRNGFTLATHLYSCMNGVVRRGTARRAGAVECAYLTEGIDVEIIADGVHLPEALIRLVYQIKGAARTALITDAMRAAGMPEGESILGAKEDGFQVIVEEGVAKLPDRTAFAGSVATADRLIRVALRAGIPVEEAVRMMTATPARILGLEDRKGSLRPGYDADIIFFNDDVKVNFTMIAGRIVHSTTST